MHRLDGKSERSIGPAVAASLLFIEFDPARHLICYVLRLIDIHDSSI